MIIFIELLHQYPLVYSSQKPRLHTNQDNNEETKTNQDTETISLTTETKE